MLFMACGLNNRRRRLRCVSHGGPRQDPVHFHEVSYKLIALTMAAGMNPFPVEGCNPLVVASRYFSETAVINKLPAGVGSCKEMVCASTGLLL